MIDKILPQLLESAKQQIADAEKGLAELKRNGGNPEMIAKFENSLKLLRSFDYEKGDKSELEKELKKYSA